MTVAVLVVLLGIALILYGTYEGRNRLVHVGIVLLVIGLILFFVPHLAL